MKTTLERSRQRLLAGSHALDTVSPLATLARGYAIINGPDGAIVRKATAVKPGQQVSARLGQGRLNCTVDSTDNK